MSTSRVGRKPIAIPAGVDIKIQDQGLLIKGAKGQLIEPLPSSVEIEIADGKLMVKQSAKAGYARSGIETKYKKSIVGTIRSKINNMITGVSKGFEKKMVLIGVGYRAQAKGKSVNLTVGYSHPVNYVAPEGITIDTPSQTEIVIKGVDKNLVGQTAASIREIRMPELYKGKGIRYADEVIILKETKKK